MRLTLLCGAVSSHLLLPSGVVWCYVWSLKPCHAIMLCHVMSVWCGLVCDVVWCRVVCGVVQGGVVWLSQFVSYLLMHTHHNTCAHNSVKRDTTVHCGCGDTTVVIRCVVTVAVVNQYSLHTNGNNTQRAAHPLHIRGHHTNN